MRAPWQGKRTGERRRRGAEESRRERNFGQENNGGGRGRGGRVEGNRETLRQEGEGKEIER